MHGGVWWIYDMLVYGGGTWRLYLDRAKAFRPHYTHHNHRLGCVYDCVKPSLPLSCPDTELYGGFPPPPYICVFITTDFSTRLALD